MISDLPPKLWVPQKPAIVRAATLREWNPSEDEFLKMLGISFINPFIHGSGVQITFASSAVSTSDLTTYSFAGQAIGTASTDRVVIVGAVGRAAANGRVVNDATIGGVSTTAFLNPTADDGGNSRCGELSALLVTSGTTATIAVTFSGAMARAAIGVWAMTGTGGSVTVHDSASVTTTNPTSTTAVDIPTNGAAVAMCFSTDTSGRTWTGLNEDFDSDLEGQVATGAHRNVTTAETGPTISVDTTAAQNPVMMVASWAPA